MTTKENTMTSYLPDLDVRVPVEQLEQDYLSVITSAIHAHPRSQQAEIGPSEIGHPCARRIAYKLSGRPEAAGKVNWKATVGTALHAWLEAAFDADNMSWVLGHGAERWLVETRVTVGQDGRGRPVTGSCDLYDRATRTVIDHKTVGPTQLTDYRRHGPSQQYRVQANLYGLGWLNVGQPVEHVAIAFLPRSGDLSEAYVWRAPFDPQMGLDALQRLAGIQLALDTLGLPTAAAALPTADAWCHLCPFYKAKSVDLADGCPGDPGSKSNFRIDPAAPAFGNL